jgi:hypothetical protein
MPQTPSFRLRVAAIRAAKRLRPLLPPPRWASPHRFINEVIPQGRGALLQAPGANLPRAASGLTVRRGRSPRRVG